MAKSCAPSAPPISTALPCPIEAVDRSKRSRSHGPPHLRPGSTRAPCRSIETAIVLSESFHVPILKRPCLKEWAPDESGISQPEYKALETRAWTDLDYLPPSKESLGMAASRARTCLESIGSDNPGRVVAVSGHGTLFALVLSELKGDRPSESYKDSIGFGSAAIIEAGSGLRLVRDFTRLDAAVL